MAPLPSHPGLAKIREVPLVQRKCVELASVHEGRLRDLLATADVMSEGLPRWEGAALVYYGTTSVLLPRRSEGGMLPDLDVAALAAVLRLDPHLRLRALRIAHREATARAGAPLGVLRSEIRIGVASRGVIISVEVAADLDQGHLRTAAASRGPLPAPPAAR